MQQKAGLKLSPAPGGGCAAEGVAAQREGNAQYSMLGAVKI